MQKYPFQHATWLHVEKGTTTIIMVLLNGAKERC